MIRRLLLQLKLKKYIRQAKQIIEFGGPDITVLIMKEFIGTHSGVDLIHRYIVVAIVAEFKRISLNLLYRETIREIDSIRLEYLNDEKYKNNLVELLKAKAELALAEKKWRNIIDGNISK